VIGVFGGTFDPIHNGHLQVALDVKQCFALDYIHFVPCKIPVHRARPQLDETQRLSLIKLAIKNQNGFIADDRELKRNSPSYMIETLNSLHDQFPDQILVLMIGSDAFAKFDEWYQWREIFERAHIMVMQRPHTNDWKGDCSTQLTAEIKQRIVNDENVSPLKKSGNLQQLLAKKSAGSIICVPVTQLEISASEIREKITKGQAIDYLVPESVRLEIRDKHYYQ